MGTPVPAPLLINFSCCGASSERGFWAHALDLSGWDSDPGNLSA